MRKITALVIALTVSGALMADEKVSTTIKSAAVSASTAVASPVEDVSDPSAHLEFEKTLHDFGTIKQGAQAKHNFKFKNTGKSDLVIGNVRTTCGCTAAVASTSPYRTGESGTVDVNYNSSGKYGYVTKEVKVESNDPSSPQVVTMQGVVIASDHPMKNTGETLFKGSCADCHATPAKGKEGKELYDAACYLCHDFPQEDGQKFIAPGRNSLSNLPKTKLRRMIAEGIPDTSMPGFHEAVGGPLSKGQVESLVEYISSLRVK